MLQLFDASGPKCIDGSPAGYYIERGARTDRYVAWIEGGGVCQGSSDCAGRAKSDLGSSTKWQQSIDMPGLLAQNATTNPEFWNATRVFVPYCSGDLWTGQHGEATNPWASFAAAAAAGGDAKIAAIAKATNDEPSFSGYFHGHLIVDAVLDDVASQSALGAAATQPPPKVDIVLTGCSAGGIGTFLNCDFVADKFGPASTTGINVKCRPEAGWFGLAIDGYADFTAGKPSEDPMHLVESLWINWVTPWTLDAANSAAARCAAAYPYPADECSAVAPKLGLEIVACCAGEFIYRYILNELC